MHGLRGLCVRLATWAIIAIEACRREVGEERQEGEEEEENGGEGRGKKRRENENTRENEQMCAWENMVPKGPVLDD